MLVVFNNLLENCIRIDCEDKAVIVITHITGKTSVIPRIRSTSPEVFLRKGVPKIWSKFTGEHPCRSVVSIKLLCNFIEIALPHACSPVNLPHIFRSSFLKNTSGRILLQNFPAI